MGFCNHLVQPSCGHFPQTPKHCHGYYRKQMTPAGLEPAIPGSAGRCLIHWATGPVMPCQPRRVFELASSLAPPPLREMHSPARPWLSPRGREGALRSLSPAQASEFGVHGHSAFKQRPGAVLRGHRCTQSPERLPAPMSDATKLPCTRLLQQGYRHTGRAYHVRLHGSRRGSQHWFCASSRSATGNEARAQHCK